MAGSDDATTTRAGCERAGAWGATGAMCQPSNDINNISEPSSSCMLRQQMGSKLQIAGREIKRIFRSIVIAFLTVYSVVALICSVCVTTLRLASAQLNWVFAIYSMRRSVEVMATILHAIDFWRQLKWTQFRNEDKPQYLFPMNSFASPNK